MKKHLALTILVISILLSVAILSACTSSTEATVSYSAMGGSVTPAFETVEKNSSVKLPTPVWVNHTFNGWFDAPENGNRIGSGGDSYAAVDSITLFAQWTDNTKNTVNISYLPEGGILEKNFDMVIEGESIILPLPTMEGSTFLGWYDNISKQTYDANTSFVANANINLYGRWERNPVISYKPVGTGATVSPAMQNVKRGTSVILPLPEWEGYDFVGWYTGQTSGTLVGKDGDTYILTEDVNLYARWTKQLMVKFIAGTGAVVTPEFEYVNQGDSIVLPTPERAGYIFLGWFTQTNGGVIVGDENANYAPQESVSIYARWEAIGLPENFDSTIDENDLFNIVDFDDSFSYYIRSYDANNTYFIYNGMNISELGEEVIGNFDENDIKTIIKNGWSKIFSAEIDLSTRFDEGQIVVVICVSSDGAIIGHSIATEIISTDPEETGDGV